MNLHDSVVFRWDPTDRSCCSTCSASSPATSALERWLRWPITATPRTMRSTTPTGPAGRSTTRPSRRRVSTGQRCCSAWRSRADAATIEWLRRADIDSWSCVDDDMVAHVQSLQDRAEVALLSNIPADLADAFLEAQPWCTSSTSLPCPDTSGSSSLTPPHSAIASLRCGLNPATSSSSTTVMRTCKQPRTSACTATSSPALID